MKIFDLSLPISNDMWSYKDEWRNRIEETQSVRGGASSTAYRFNLASHTGTYIETAEHKLPVSYPLQAKPIESFYRPVKLIAAPVRSNNVITLNDLRSEADRLKITLSEGDALIVACGHGLGHREETYLSTAPHFEEELTKFLCELKLDLLGVDTPRLEDVGRPYDPVRKLFSANRDMLLLAPLKIDLSLVRSGEYFLSCAPLAIEQVSVSLCRPLLIEDYPQ